MSYDPRTDPDVSQAARAWNAAGATTAGPVAPATPRQPASVGAGQQQHQQQHQQAAAGEHRLRAAATPNVDVVESEQEVVVLLDAPGFEEDHITVHADANNLYVTADRSEDPSAGSADGERTLLRERPVRLERAITLPGYIDPEQATAEHENGVCRIVVPKDEEERRHEIAFQ